MKVTVLSSGSKGNATLVETENKNILIDAGLTLTSLAKRIDKLPNIDILIITHSHIDHIKGIASVVKRYKPIIITKSKDIIELYPQAISAFKEEDLDISLFSLSHDTPCTGVSIACCDKELIYITDTGYINEKLFSKISNKDIYVMESNHDVEMLRNGKYPFFLQKRILGDKGHLSNEDSVFYLNKIIGEKTKYIVLAHLSEENNTEENVRNSSKRIKGNANILIAKQKESLETIEV